MFGTLSATASITPKILLENNDSFAKFNVDELTEFLSLQNLSPEVRFTLLTYLLAEILPLAQLKYGFLNNLTWHIGNYLTQKIQDLMSCNDVNNPFITLITITTLDFKKTEKTAIHRKNLMHLELLAEINKKLDTIRLELKEEINQNVSVVNISDNNESNENNAKALLATTLESWLKLAYQFEFNFNFLTKWKKTDLSGLPAKQQSAITIFHDTLRQNMFTAPRPIMEIWAKETAVNRVTAAIALLSTDENDQQLFKHFLANQTQKVKQALDTPSNTENIPKILTVAEREVDFLKKLELLDQKLQKFILHIDSLAFRQGALAKNILEHQEAVRSLKQDCNYLDDKFGKFIDKLLVQLKKARNTLELESLKEEYSNLVGEIIIFKLASNLLSNAIPRWNFLKVIIPLITIPEMQFIVITIAIGLEIKRMPNYEVTFEHNVVLNRIKEYLSEKIDHLEKMCKKGDATPTVLIQLLQHTHTFFSNLSNASIELSKLNHSKILDVVEQLARDMPLNIYEWLTKWVILGRQLEENLNALQIWAEMHPEIDANIDTKIIEQRAVVCFYDVLHQNAFSDPQSIIEDKWAVEMEIAEKSRALNIPETTIMRALLISNKEERQFFEKLLPPEEETNSLPVYQTSQSTTLVRTPTPEL